MHNNVYNHFPAANPQRWKSGDVLGAGLNFDVSTPCQEFYLNGKSLGAAFSGWDMKSSRGTH